MESGLHCSTKRNGTVPRVSFRKGGGGGGGGGGALAMVHPPWDFSNIGFRGLSESMKFILCALHISIKLTFEP